MADKNGIYIQPLWALSACAVVDGLRSGALSARAVLEAALDRAAACNPLVGALVMGKPEAARHRADHFDRARADGHDVGPMGLAGMPLLIKDLTDVAGLPTTLGDPDRHEAVAPVSDAVVERLEARGAVIHGKSNVPFLGLGSDTANPLFGLTRNPWALTHTTAGSSGGAAAALACGMAWLAHGTDLGGSIRGPASHCGVVGLRPTPGRVGHGGPRTRRMPLDVLNVDGPMARSVEDCALLLDAMAGPAAADPLALPAAPDGCFRAAARAPRQPRRVAATLDFGGITAVHDDVARVFDEVLRRLSAAGVEIVRAHPPGSGVADAAYDLRLGATRARMTPAERERIAPHLGTIARAMHDDADRLTLPRLLAAQERQQQLVRDMATLFESHDLLITPVVATPPALHHGGEVHTAAARGRHWAEDAIHAYGITLTQCPALAIPAGFSRDGLPIGIQLVAPWREEAALVSMGAAIEALLAGTAPRAPIEPRPQPITPGPTS